MASIIKIMFRSRPKIYNEKTIYKVMLLKELTLNGIDPYKTLEMEHLTSTKNEREKWRWVFKKVNTPEVKNYTLPILTSSTLTNTKTYLLNLLYNYS